MRFIPIKTWASLALAAMCLTVGGCAAFQDAAQGAREGALQALKDAPPPDPSRGTLWYGLGSLAAYLVGSLGKGYIRSKLEKGDPS